MSTNFTRNTSIPKVFTIGWFRFPTSVDTNYEVVIILHDILVVVSFFINPILLYVIIKTFRNSSGKNSGILLASICLTNIFVTGFGVLQLFSGSAVDHEIMSRAMSIFLPMYYVTTFCLALNNYWLIVTPLKFQTFSPKPKTMASILGLVWITLTLVLVATPSLVSDFDQTIMLTTIVALCWFTSIVIAIMYAKILLTLYQRKITLHKTLNMSRSRQGLVVIKQNARLAQVLFFYILVLVVLTLPLYTSVVLALHCSSCDNPALVKFSVYAIPAAMCVPVIHVFHWLLLTPQYYREVKRLLNKVFVFCGKNACVTS